MVADVSWRLQQRGFENSISHRSLNKIVDKLMRYFFSWYSICVYSLFIIILSVFPFQSQSPQIFFLFDKVIHFLIYAILSFMMVNTFYLKRQNHFKLAAFSYSFFLGLFLECVQSFLPFRSFETQDVFSNFLGSLLGCLLRVV